jgi:DNA-binding CsgD family transcriptional regulator
MSAAREPPDALIDQLYDAAAGLCDWHEVLANVARLIGGSAAVLGIVGPRSPARIVHVGVDPAYMTRYAERYGGRNELALRSAACPIGSVLTIESLMPKADFLRTAFYDECLRPQGLRSLINLRAARGASGAVANVCVLRSGKGGEFSTEDAEVFSRLAPHLRRAVMVHARLTEAEGERRALTETLERLPRVAFLVDAAATVRLANAAGTALLAARDGLRVDLSDGSALRADQPAETIQLRHLIAAMVLNPGGDPPFNGQLCVSRPFPKPPLVVTAVPLSAARAAAAGLPPLAMALLLVTDPDQRAASPPPALLRKTFGLTRTEAEVATRAATGEGVPALASSLGISQGTARLHLHRIFEKIGVHRQAELAAVLARLGS